MLRGRNFVGLFYFQVLFCDKIIIRSIYLDHVNVRESRNCGVSGGSQSCGAGSSATVQRTSLTLPFLVREQRQLLPLYN
jgi:hypothetical protein